MSDERPSYDELRQRLEQAEATLDALRRGEVDLVIGNTAPLIVQFRSIVEERAQLLESLQRETRYWQETFDALAHPVFILDRDQRILRSNKGAERFFARPREAFIGRHCWEIVHGTREPIPECPLLRAQHSLCTETEIIQTHESWLKDTVHPIQDGNGGYAGAVHMIEDITQQKQDSKALEEMLEIINKSSAVAFTWKNEEGWPVTFVSENVRKIFGYTAEEFISGKVRYAGCLHPEDLEKVVKEVEEYSSKEEVAEFTHQPYRIIAKDGSEKTVRDWTYVVRDKSGRITHYKGIIEDITEQIRAKKEYQEMQDQLHHAQKMESIGVLAGGVAHDFNNLLTTIIGNAQLMVGELEKEDPHVEDLEEIIKAGERGADLIRRLLTFSRRETRSPELVDLNKALEETRKMLRRLLREDIELEIIPGPDLWQVYMDPSQMDQIIMNLAVNARDAMPDGGTLTIETANVELDHAYFSKHGVDNQPGSYVMLAVTDTGVGMTEEVRQKMFDPFFTTKERGTGTGLGLATVYGAVKQNGGYIWAYSEPGQGTTMKVYLPRATEGIAPDRKEHVEVSGLTGEETVLLTEDDDLVRKMIVRFLSKYGYRVLEAANGKEAMEISRQFRGTIHLLITDVIMPGMNGKELSERLRSERPDMKVLFMSGYTQNIIMQKGILPATIHYAQKPFSERTFALKVREVMEEQGE